MALIETVKPAGGGDFLTIQLWENAASLLLTADNHAECYTGGDLAICTAIAWASFPTAVLFPRVYTLLAERHSGKNDGTGASIIVPDFAAGLALTIQFFHVEGIRLTTGFGTVGIFFVGESAIVTGGFADSNMVISDHADSFIFAIVFRSRNQQMSGFIAQNNIIYGLEDGSVIRPILGITFNAQAFTADAFVEFVCYNNSVTQCGSVGTTGVAYFFLEEELAGNTATVDGSAINNTGTESAFDDFGKLNDSGPYVGTITGSNNCSSDTTADVVSLTNNLTLQDPLDLYLDPINDIFPKDLSPLLNAAITIGTFDWDATHLVADSWRPQGTDWCIGAIDIMYPPAPPAGDAEGWGESAFYNGFSPAANSGFN